MYADTVTDSMQRAIDETGRRREIQTNYNAEHNITPTSISKDILDIIEREYRSDDMLADYVADYKTAYKSANIETLKKLSTTIKDDMLAAAENMEFEKAAVLRDQMMEIENKILLLGKAKK